jgi:DNA topoisomerase-1
VSVKGDTVRLAFVGKSGVAWDVKLTDARYARLMEQQLKRVRGDDDPVFQVNGRPLHADDVNDYLAPFDATAKKFRTFHATRLAREDLLQHEDAPPAQREQLVSEMFVHVAAKLGHTPAVDREHYVDPMVVQAFLQGKLT